jgi:hypothetical protein
MTLWEAFTFKELIDTVHANESTKDAASVTRTFENILQANLEDARSLLRQHMKDILTELKIKRIPI